MLILIFDMTRGLLHLFFILSTVILYTYAGGCVSKEPDACPNRPRRGERWACEDPRLPFPTVAYLTKDILTCGKVGDKSYVFYSFGAKGFDARNYANNDLNGRGVTFHDAVEKDYILKVIGHARFSMTDKTRNGMNLNRQNIFVRKLSQAFASICKNDAFLMITKRDGKGSGVRAYQTPWVDGKPEQDRQDNVWENDEFPALQLNDKINRVYSVDVSNGNAKNVDWTKGQPKKPLRNVEAIQLPS